MFATAQGGQGMRCGSGERYRPNCLDTSPNPAGQRDAVRRLGRDTSIRDVGPRRPERRGGGRARVEDGQPHITVIGNTVDVH